jgi:hypothetical protein
VAAHGRAVAALGGRIAGALNEIGFSLNLDLIVSGGLLHDLAKGKPNHARRGGRLISCLGFSSLSKIIVSHMDFEFTPEKPIDESAVVFLAEKLIKGDQPVSITERFQPAWEKFSSSPAITAAVSRRMRAAEAIRDRIINLVGINRFHELVWQKGENNESSIR